MTDRFPNNPFPRGSVWGDRLDEYHAHHQGSTSATSETVATNNVCPHCGLIHQTTCQRIKAMEFHPDGVTVKRIEFHEPRPMYWPESGKPEFIAYGGRRWGKTLVEEIKRNTAPRPRADVDR